MGVSLTESWVRVDEGGESGLGREGTSAGTLGLDRMVYAGVIE